MSSRPNPEQSSKRTAGAKNSKGRRTPISLDLFFGPHGPLSDHLTNYEQRPEQISVSNAIQTAMSMGKPCLAEAGTGVGKTMAYLVPAVQAALTSNKRTIISTHTISLQNQLVTKDLPLVTSLIPGAEENVPFELMKGRSNYLCDVALDYARTDMFLAGDPLFKRVQKWASGATCTGDVADLPFSFSAWSEITSTPEMCPAGQCPKYDTCHFYTMRRIAAESKIIVVNHALFFSDLALRTDDPNSGFLPDYDHVIFDEAHHLEDVATKTFGVEFSSRRLVNLVDRIKRMKGLDLDPERLKTLEDQNSRLFSPFQSLSKNEFTFEEALPKEAHTRAEELTGQTVNSLNELQLKLLDAAREDDVHKDHLEGLARMCGSARAELHRLFFESDDNAIRWGEAALAKGTSAEPRVSLHLTPIDVAKVLSSALWERMQIKGGSVVLVSATLSNSGGFSYQRARLGVPETAIECIVGSPFDFKQQAILYVPAHLPAPAPGAEYADLLAEEIRKVVTLTHGRAFLLFTSRYMMNAIYDRLEPDLPFPLFRQGDLPPGALIREFKDSGNGCLLGLQTFWEGVDIQGEALTCVIIDRLPFAVPDSPITRARTKAIADAGGDWFYDYSIPQAQIRLKQGFGRLIRTRTDVGIVCILDTRMLTRGYGAEFVKFLPPASRASKWLRMEKLYAERMPKAKMAEYLPATDKPDPVVREERSTQLELL